ncbi:MAG: choice-of-anchor Q domain-containing protein [Bacteroidales bacterium]|nr:choice-of-anchor Q domain-containing protein [Bacteroidales bacterium]
MNKLFLFFLTIVLCFSSCEKKRYFTGEMPGLQFSDDTIHFDTVFTSTGAVTRELRIKNPYRSWLLIDRIELAGGDDSPFRMNFDGIPGTVFTDIEIAPADSLFIFIDAFIDPNDSDNPVLISDSIEFETGNNILDVNLIAWGQDINLVISATVETATWTEGKPYVVYNSMLVDTGQVLTITEGARILFHRGSTMYVAGTLIVEGTVDKPVCFDSDRIEPMYSDIPGQWQGLYFLNGSTGNIIRNAGIRNAVSGLHAGNLESEDPAPGLQLHNLIISHMSVSGISSLGADIYAENTVISHCGAYCAFLAMGGKYTFIHCTMANQWDYSNRLSPALYISDFFDYNEERYTGELVKAGFYNSVITGNKDTEIYTDSHDEGNLDVEFVSCLIQSTDLLDYPCDNCILNQDPRFVSWSDYDFRPDTLSPLINAGSYYYADMVQFDLRGFDRLDDDGPDLGAYERQTDEKAENK